MRRRRSSAVPPPPGPGRCAPGRARGRASPTAHRKRPRGRPRHPRSDSGSTWCGSRRRRGAPRPAARRRDRAVAPGRLSRTPVRYPPPGCPSRSSRHRRCPARGTSPRSRHTGSDRRPRQPPPPAHAFGDRKAFSSSAAYRRPSTPRPLRVTRSRPPPRRTTRRRGRRRHPDRERRCSARTNGPRPPSGGTPRRPAGHCRQEAAHRSPAAHAGCRATLPRNREDAPRGPLRTPRARSD